MIERLLVGTIFCTIFIIIGIILMVLFITKKRKRYIILSTIFFIATALIPVKVEESFLPPPVPKGAIYEVVLFEKCYKNIYNITINSKIGSE